jgi:hypothetical protein
LSGLAADDRMGCCSRAVTRFAIEVETAKALDQYLAILDAYADQGWRRTGT